MWGKMVCLETLIEDTLSFESMKILIDNDRFHDIEGHFILHTGDVGFRVMTKEASCIFQINPQFVVPARSASIEDKAPIEAKKGTEIQGDGVDSTNEMESNHCLNANRVDVANSKGVAKETPRFEFEVGNSLHSASINSSSKTKTTQFSQNVYSRILLKSRSRFQHPKMYRRTITESPHYL